MRDDQRPWRSRQNTMAAAASTTASQNESRGGAARLPSTGATLRSERTRGEVVVGAGASSSLVSAVASAAGAVSAFRSASFVIDGSARSAASPDEDGGA